MLHGMLQEFKIQRRGIVHRRGLLLARSHLLMLSEEMGALFFSRTLIIICVNRSVYSMNSRLPRAQEKK